MQSLSEDEQKALFKKLSSARKVGKSAVYASAYGAKPATIARSAKVALDDAEKLYEAYWKINWSVLATADNLTVKTVRGQKWLFNPVSKMWYSLRYEKDRFSTLNQGTGVYCFDTWVKKIRERRKQLTGQFHDEVILCIKKGNRDKAKELLSWAIDETNKELNLNVKLGVDVQFGNDYSEIH